MDQRSRQLGHTPFCFFGVRNGLRLRNVQILADLLREKIVDLSMTGNGGGFPRSPVDVDTVIAAFPKKLNAVAFEMTDQIDPLYEIEARGSRITVKLRRPSSASARFDSNTS